MASAIKVAVLTSGGLDSAILTDYFLKKGETVQPLYVQNGHVWERTEFLWLKRFLKAISHKCLKPLVVLSLPTLDLYENHWSITGKHVPSASSNDEKVYLPGKNLLLISKVAVFCALKKIPNLALGPLKTNPFPDAKPSFFKSIEKACSEGLNYRLRILAPFFRLSKKEVMKLGQNLPLHLTFSCLAPKGLRHCGCCNKCAERKTAFRQAHVVDRTLYAR